MEVTVFNFTVEIILQFCQSETLIVFCCILVLDPTGVRNAGRMRHTKVRVGWELIPLLQLEQNVV